MTSIASIASVQSAFVFAGNTHASAATASASSVAQAAQAAQLSLRPNRSESSAAPVDSTSVDRFSAQEQQLLAQLRQSDRVVRAHEQAHLAVGAGLVRGAASFSLQVGPDKRSYAVAGEVAIDTSPGSTPQETIAKARQIRAAALAPADPSAQDLRVAARASSLESEARIEWSMQQRADESAASYRGVAQDGGGSVGTSLDAYA